MSSVCLLASCFALAVFSGCSTLAPPPYSADYQILDQLKKQPLEKVAVATFQPRNPDAPVNKISLRAANLAGPKGTFAQYLEDALIQDLKEIAVFDTAAGTRIDATILKNDIDVSGFSTGTGRMDVELTVTRNAKTSLKKTYSASTTFDSSFAGAVAIPKGQSEYGNLVRTLLGKVYADPQFINALKR